MVGACEDVHGLAPMRETGAGLGARMRRPLLSSLLAAGAALAVCAVLLVSMRPEGGPGALLDKEAAEIAQLQREKGELEHELETGRAPLLHPRVLKAEVRRAARMKASMQQGQHWAKAPVQTLRQTTSAVTPKPDLTKLQAEREALEKQILAYKQQAAKQQDPLMGGILAAFKPDTGAGVLSRTGTMHAANQGLLGRVGEDESSRDDNVLGSLAATMTKVQDEKMLQDEHVRQLDNVAKAMGDVSPKEALAQRIIALGAQFLAEPDTVAAAPTGPSHTGDAARRAHARGRVAQMHARMSAARAASAAPAVAHGASDSSLSSSHGKLHSKAVSVAKDRVELLRRELKEAETVAQLQNKLQKEQSKLAATHAMEARLKLASGGVHTQLQSDKEDTKHLTAYDKYNNAYKEIRKYVGKNGKKLGKKLRFKDEVKSTMRARFRKEAHGRGYIRGAIYVGSPENGPDRYGQQGAGPQIIKGKLGDNVVDVGILGAAGTIEGDVLVPTKLSGVRDRDFPRQNDSRKFKVGHVDTQTSNAVVKGTLDLGEHGLQMDDLAVPLDKVSGALYKDRARTQTLAQD